jgi:hypothetical protein
MIDKMKQLQKKPPDKWYEEIYKFERKIVKWLCTYAQPQLVDPGKICTLRWLRKAKGKRKAFEIGNESKKINHWLLLKELNNNNTVWSNFLDNHLQIPLEPSEFKENMIVEEILKVEKIILMLSIKDVDGKPEIIEKY